MHKRIVFAICGCLFFIGGFAQNSGRELLNEIEKNNIRLNGFKSFVESEKLQNKSTNNLPNPQAKGYYLPFGNNQTSTYTEFEISQSFEFPSVYAARGKWNTLKAQELETEYLKVRQEVLLKAKLLLADFAMLQQQKEIAVARQEQAKQVLDQIETLYAKGQIGILDLNKAKIAWLQEQFATEQLQTEIQIVLDKLKKLNGGNDFELSGMGIQEPLQIPAMDSLWEEKLANDPIIRELKINQAASQQKIALEKNKILPDLSIGYNYQGVSGNNFSGFFGGISIPLWNSKNKVKAAEANYRFQQSKTQLVTAGLYVDFQEQYNRYLLLLEKFKEYQAVMENLESEKLLFKAYTLGEFSFMDYYRELRFYRNALDKKLQMEKELYQLKARLLKHRL